MYSICIAYIPSRKSGWQVPTMLAPGPAAGKQDSIRSDTQSKFYLHAGVTLLQVADELSSAIPFGA
jgi:hypothetical protein